jgi:hypothetical protein
MKVEVRVEAMDVGDQVELAHQVLLGLAYDPRDDLFEVSTETTRHLIGHPGAIQVEENAVGLQAIQVVDGDDVQHIVTLNRVVPLPEA